MDYSEIIRNLQSRQRPKSLEFRRLVLDSVTRIPVGKVTTYGIYAVILTYRYSVHDSTINTYQNSVGFKS
jgi:O6-methylguanine-DNA--protein-cysteine methyltransferase